MNGSLFPPLTSGWNIWLVLRPRVMLKNVSLWNTYTHSSQLDEELGGWGASRYPCLPHSSSRAFTAEVIFPWFLSPEAENWICINAQKMKMYSCNVEFKKKFFSKIVPLAIKQTITVAKKIITQAKWTPLLTGTGWPEFPGPDGKKRRMINPWTNIKYDLSRRHDLSRSPFL